MIQKIVHRLVVTTFVAFISSLSLLAQHKVEMFPFGDMDQWVDRQIKESGIIGGNTKNVYEIAPTAVIQGDQVYKNMGGSPWGTSNVMAKVAGITKTNTSVFPEKRGEGYCARLFSQKKGGLLISLCWRQVLFLQGRCMNLLRVLRIRRRCCNVACRLLKNRWHFNLIIK